MASRWLCSRPHPPRRPWPRARRPAPARSRRHACASSSTCWKIQGCATGWRRNGPPASRRRRPPPAAPSEKAKIEGYFATPVAAIRQHFASLAAAVPMLPADFEQARARLVADLQDRGLVEILLLSAGFVALGFGAEWLFWRVTVAAHERISELDLTTVGDRLRAVAMRLAFGTGLVVAFALGSVGAFLPFHWPPLLREIVLGYLLAFLVLRLALVIGRFLLAPGAGATSSASASSR